jgi:hypothetical protein
MYEVVSKDELRNLLFRRIIIVGLCTRIEIGVFTKGE